MLLESKYLLNVCSTSKTFVYVAIPESVFTQLLFLLVKIKTWSVNSTPPKLEYIPGCVAM